MTDTSNVNDRDQVCSRVIAVYSWQSDSNQILIEASPSRDTANYLLAWCLVGLISFRES